MNETEVELLEKIIDFHKLSNILAVTITIFLIGAIYVIWRQFEKDEKENM